MALLIAIVLAVLVLPPPWNLVVVAVASCWEIATTLGAVSWSQRRSARIGAEAMLGREVPVRDDCRPLGRVSVKGELWRARCDAGANRGESVRIVGIDGLTLRVEPAMPLRAGS